MSSPEIATPRSPLRRLLAWLTFAVPLLYLAVVLWLQPRDRLGSPDSDWPIGRMLYDDYDMTAMALRGLNAKNGRIAGAGEPPIIDPQQFVEDLDFPRPLHSRYFLEYPHASLLLFRLGWLGPELSVPNAVADAVQHSIVWHQPRDEGERNLWHRFRRAIQTYEAVMIGCLIGLMLIISRGYEPNHGLSGSTYLLILPATLYFTLNRFDVLPALLLAGSLACLGRNRIGWSAALLGTATMFKVFPVLVAPLVFRYLSDRWRTALTWAAIYSATLIVFLIPPLCLSGIDATLAPYRFQLTRAAEPGWTLYGIVLPNELSEKSLFASGFRFGSVALAGLLLFAQRPTEMAGLLRRSAIVLIIFVALQVFWSPQWLLWLVPLLVPLARIHRAVFVMWIVLDVSTYLSFPMTFDLQLDALRPWLIWLRAALLLGLAGFLAWQELLSSEPGVAKSASVTVPSV